MVPHAMIHVRAVNNSAVDDGAVSALNDGALHTARGGSAAAAAAPAAQQLRERCRSACVQRAGTYRQRRRRRREERSRSCQRTCTFLVRKMRTVCGFARLHNRRRVHHKKWCESSTAMGPRVATNGLRSRTLTCVYLQGGRSQVRGRRGMAWGTWEPPVACRAGPWSKRSRQRPPPPARA